MKKFSLWWCILRWGGPIITTLGLGVLLLHTSHEPIFFSRYSFPMLVFLAGMGITSLTYWWITLNKERFNYLFKRLSHVPFFSVTAVALGVLFLCDGIYGFEDANLESAFMAVFYSALPVRYVVPYGLSLVILLLSAKSPKIILWNVAIGLISAAIGLMSIEFIFRTTLLRNGIPATEQEFEDLISSDWPRPISIEKTPGVFRILGLADSFGRIGAAQNYHYLLEALLRQDSPGVEIVNISRGNYQPPDELAVLQAFGTRYQPDLILHGIFVGNDFFDDAYIRTRAPLRLYRSIGVRPRQPFYYYRPSTYALFSWLKNYFNVIRNTQLLQKEIALQQPSGIYAENNFWKIMRFSFQKNCRIDPPPEERWQAFIDVLDQIRNECAHINAQYVMVIHPEQYQVESAILEQILQRFALPVEEYDLDLPQRFLQVYCEENELLCLDLLPTFKRQGSNGGLYTFRDDHYNVNGNTVAAHAIAQFFIEQELWPLTRNDSSNVRGSIVVGNFRTGL